MNYRCKISLFSNKRRFFRVNFPINAEFKHRRIQRLLGGGVYFTFRFLIAPFIGGRRLKEEKPVPVNYCDMLHRTVLYSSGVSKII